VTPCTCNCKCSEKSVHVKVAVALESPELQAQILKTLREAIRQQGGNTKLALGS